MTRLREALTKRVDRLSFLDLLTVGALVVVYFVFFAIA